LQVEKQLEKVRLKGVMLVAEKMEKVALQKMQD
jgi:hypothetical protein